MSQGGPCQGRSIECKDPEMWESCGTALLTAELGKCVHYGRPDITMGLINNSLINNNLHVTWTSSIIEAGNNWGMRLTTVGDPSVGSTECSATCKENALVGSRTHHRRCGSRPTTPVGD